MIPSQPLRWIPLALNHQRPRRESWFPQNSQIPASITVRRMPVPHRPGKIVTVPDEAAETSSPAVSPCPPRPHRDRKVSNWRKNPLTHPPSRRDGSSRRGSSLFVLTAWFVSSDPPGSVHAVIAGIAISPSCSFCNLPVSRKLASFA